MGLKKVCTKFKVVMARSAAGKRRALRCADFQKPSKAGGIHPKCATKSNTTGNKALTGGGRSKGLIRKVHCSKR